MNKKIITGLASVVVVLGGIVGVASASSVNQEPKVTICHRANSVTNPYQKIEVAASAVDGEGNNDHTQHTGPVATSEAVAQALKDDKKKWGDIIPDKLNWTAEGQAVYNNDCKYVIPEQPADVCNNIDGNQATVPEGYTAKDGACNKNEVVVTSPVVTPPTVTPPATAKGNPTVNTPAEEPPVDSSFQGK